LQSYIVGIKYISLNRFEVDTGDTARFTAVTTEGTQADGGHITVRTQTMIRLCGSQMTTSGSGPEIMPMRLQGKGVTSTLPLWYF
jgi:hypothetical protein